MNTVYVVKVASDLGIQWFYAGVSTEEEALLLAADNGHTGDAIEAKSVVNREAVQPGEWRWISVGM